MYEGELCLQSGLRKICIHHIAFIHAAAGMYAETECIHGGSGQNYKKSREGRN